jgi:hypothetical protein
VPPRPCEPLAERKVSTECEAHVNRGAAADGVAGNTGEAVVEVTAADGAKLTVRIPVASFNISALIHDFRSRA